MQTTAPSNEAKAILVLNSLQTGDTSAANFEDGLIVEHWDVIAPIPPQSEWQNQNGKF